MPNTWSNAENWQQNVVRSAGAVSAVLAALSICISLHSQYWYPRIYGFWIIGPPVWFFCEYFFLFDRKEDNPALAFEQLKYGQDVAQKIWAALLVLLAAIGYFKWHLSLSAH